MGVSEQLLPVGLLGEPRARVREMLGRCVSWQEWCGIAIEEPAPGEVEAAATAFVGFGAIPWVDGDEEVRAVVGVPQPWSSEREGGSFTVASGEVVVIVVAPVERLLASLEEEEEGEPEGEPDPPPPEGSGEAGGEEDSAQDALVYTESDAETLFCNRLSGVVAELWEVAGSIGFVDSIDIESVGVGPVKEKGSASGRVVGAVVVIGYGMR